MPKANPLCSAKASQPVTHDTISVITPSAPFSGFVGCRSLDKTKPVASTSTVSILVAPKSTPNVNGFFKL